MNLMNLDHQMALRAVTNGKAPAHCHRDLFVGRSTELAMSNRDLDVNEARGASLRILVGEPGSGKTMLQHAMASQARKRGFVTATADLDPDSLLHGRSGEGRSLLRKAVLNMQTATSGDESGLDSIVGRFGNDCRIGADAAGQLPLEYARGKLAEVNKLPKGADFARVIAPFSLAMESSAVAAKSQRWLRGDYATITDARDDLGIGGIIEDQDFWPIQKVWASFIQAAGRPGYVLFLDEARVIGDLHPTSRMLNLEHLLMIYNDVLQGRVRGIGVVIAVTTSFVTQWNGLAKHEGLSSCLLHQKEQLELNPETDTVLVPLQDLADGEIIEMLQRCRELYAASHPAARLVPDEALELFVETCRNQIGEARWRVPRTILQRFVGFQDRVMGEPNADWRELLSAQNPESDNSDWEFEGYAQRQM